MTRFARAKGSKASNERVPEEATPWHKMKQEMQNQQQQKRESSTAAASKKYMIFAENEISGSTWAEFEVGKSEKKIKHSKTKDRNDSRASSAVTNVQDGNEKKKKNKLHKVVANESFKAEKKLLKKKRRMSDMKDTIKSSNASEENVHFKKTSDQDKNKQSKSKEVKEAVNLQADSGIANKSRDETSISKKTKPIFKKRKFKDSKGKGGNVHKRKKPEDSKSSTMFINGKEIEVVKYDGFPVKKEDAVRLAELRAKLKARGIPHESIVATMKLERRRAEKALARERKKVCFHCRKSGHILSECPELTETAENEAGICFKCGSTEHTHFQCKVSRGEDYRYASCFICKEQGHIARQCPDNPRGLYPKGGACKICGAVTHLKKDCPDLIQEKEQQIITLKPLSNTALEALDDDLNTSESPAVVKKNKKKKTVTF